MIFAQEYTPSTAYTFKRSHAGRKKDEWLERWISLDTETSHNHASDPKEAVGWIYQWAFKFGYDVVVGRKPSELVAALRRIAEYYQLGNGKRAVVYIHNASYDLQYLKEWLYKEFGAYKILASKEHHIISYTNEFFSIKCSYVLSNKSLAKWSKDLGCTNSKLEGLVDYDIIRKQTDSLTGDDWAYMLGDVETLDECVERQLALYRDTIATVPLTATGYIRRACRNNFQKSPKNWKAFTHSRLNAHTYQLFRSEFAGGLTHGDRFRAGKTIRPTEGETIRHRDFRSHYPSQQRTREFPLSRYNLYDFNVSRDTLVEKMEEYSVLVQCTITNAAIKSPDVTFPTLQVSKCLEGRRGSVHLVKDNGRVLQLRGTATLVFTGEDIKWFWRLYDAERVTYDELWIAKRGDLPEFMRETIDTYFKGKTEYKIKEELERDPTKKLDYKLSLMKAKNGLNGIYGMSAQQSVRPEYDLLPEGDDPWRVEFPEDVQGALDKYYNSRNSFMRYQWGCVTTAAARDELLTLIYDVIGAERCLYCDTDSIFYISTPEVEARVEAWNLERRQRSEALGAYIDYEGKRVHYDQFTEEEDSGHITAFRFLHSKCYAFTTDDGELHCTIAGVQARVIDHLDEEGKPVYYTREEELGNLENLRPKTVFTRCGGTSIVYYDMPIAHHPVYGEVASSAIISNVTKTLNSEVEPQVDHFINVYGGIDL